MKRLFTSTFILVTVFKIAIGQLSVKPIYDNPKSFIKIIERDVDTSNLKGSDILLKSRILTNNSSLIGANSNQFISIHFDPLASNYHFTINFLRIKGHQINVDYSIGYYAKNNDTYGVFLNSDLSMNLQNKIIDKIKCDKKYLYNENFKSSWEITPYDILYKTFTKSTNIVLLHVDEITYSYFLKKTQEYDLTSTSITSTIFKDILKYDIKNWNISSYSRDAITIDNTSKFIKLNVNELLYNYNEMYRMSDFTNELASFNIAFNVHLEGVNYLTENTLSISTIDISKFEKTNIKLFGVEQFIKSGTYLGNLENGVPNGTGKLKLVLHSDSYKFFNIDSLQLDCLWKDGVCDNFKLISCNANDVSFYEKDTTGNSFVYYYSSNGNIKSKKSLTSNSTSIFYEPVVKFWPEISSPIASYRFNMEEQKWELDENFNVTSSLTRVANLEGVNLLGKGDVRYENLGYELESKGYVIDKEKKQLYSYNSNRENLPKGLKKTKEVEVIYQLMEGKFVRTEDEKTEFWDIRNNDSFTQLSFGNNKTILTERFQDKISYKNNKPHKVFRYDAIEDRYTEGYVGGPYWLYDIKSSAGGGKIEGKKMYMDKNGLLVGAGKNYVKHGGKSHKYDIYCVYSQDRKSSICRVESPKRSLIPVWEELIDFIDYFGGKAEEVICGKQPSDNCNFSISGGYDSENGFVFFDPDGNVVQQKQIFPPFEASDEYIAYSNEYFSSKHFTQVKNIENIDLSTLTIEPVYYDSYFDIEQQINFNIENAMPELLDLEAQGNIILASVEELFYWQKQLPDAYFNITFLPPNFTGIFREPVNGVGWFAGPRGPNRLHPGTDYASNPGDPVISPVAGKVEYVGHAYGEPTINDSESLAKLKNELRSIHIKQESGDLKFVVLYVNSSVKKGDKLRMGDQIGTTGRLQQYYSEKPNPSYVPDHLHLNIIDNNGYFYDPTFRMRMKYNRKKSPKPPVQVLPDAVVRPL